MPHAPALIAHPRRGRITTRRLALRAAGGESADANWIAEAREFDLAGVSLTLGVESFEDFSVLEVVLRNTSAEARRVDELCLTFDWEPGETGTGPLRGLSLEVSSAASSRVVEFDAAGVSSRTALLLGGPGGCVLFGAREAGVASWHAQARAHEGRVEFELRASLDVSLAPGESRRLDAIDLSIGDEASPLLEAYAERWGRDVGARAWRPAPLVWALPDSSTASVSSLRRVLAALTAQPQAPPLQVLMLPGSAETDPGRDGFAALVREAGIVPGLRVAPFGDLDLDPEDALSQVQERFRSLHAAGFFCFELAGLDRVPDALLRSGLEAVRRGASDEAFLLVGEGPFGSIAGVVDARIASGDAPDREARLHTWMHRRLWIGASTQAEAAETGASLVARIDPSTAPPSELARWTRAADEARRVDERGLPGAARIVDLLGEARRIAIVDEVQQPAAPLTVFCDFDGTFSVQDVGATLAVRYGGERRPKQWARYEGGEITPWGYNLEILDGLPVDTAALDAFLDEIDLDPGARALLAWCQEREVPFRILSDGFDWNLNRLQWCNGVRFPYTANHLWIEHGRWQIRPGAPDASCGCGTGTCKAGILRRHAARHPNAHRVHIGNGRVSDSCGAIEAETAFAKDSLADSLTRRGVPFVPFETLHDVIPELEKILARGGVRPGPA